MSNKSIKINTIIFPIIRSLLRAPLTGRMPVASDVYIDATAVYRLRETDTFMFHEFIMHNFVRAFCLQAHLFDETIHKYKQCTCFFTPPN